MAWTVTSVLPLSVCLFHRSSSSMFTPAHPVHPSWSSSSTSRLRPVLIHSGANSSQTQPQCFLPLECRRFSGIFCFIVGNFRTTCCPSLVCGFLVMTSRMAFPCVPWFCTDAVVLTACGIWRHSVLCSTLLHSALKKRLRLHFWYREPLLANLVRSCRQLTVCGSSSFCSIVVAGSGSNRQLDFTGPARPRSAPCPDRPLLQSIRETFIAFHRFLFKEAFPLGKEMQFGGVPERLLLFSSSCTSRILPLGSKRRYRGLYWFLGFCSSRTVVTRFPRVPGVRHHCLPQRPWPHCGREWPWRTTNAVSGLACRWTADVQNHATRGCPHSSS